jgi:hypothetical protein
VHFVSRWRVVFALGSALLALGAFGSPAAAHVTSTSGSHGNYVIADTSDHPAAHCYYGNASSSSQDLTKIKIPAPTVYAKDSTSHRDSQKVGWQFVIQHGTSVGSFPSGWKTSYTSSVVKATGYDNQAASFSSRTWTATPNINRWWRVKIYLLWYQPGSSTTVAGEVKDIVDYYTITYPPNPDGFNPTDCIPGE